MKRTKNMTFPRTPWGGVKTGSLPMMLAGLVLAGWLTPSVFGAPKNPTANGSDNKYFTATISPTSVGAGSTTAFTITIEPCDGTNCEPENNNGNAIVDVEIAGPAESPMTGPLSASASDSGKTWNASFSSGNLLLEADSGNDKIGIGESVSVTFNWTAPTPQPCVEHDYTWTATGSSGNGSIDWSYAGDPLTVTVKCGAEMPVNKLVDGISAVCDDASTPGTDESGNGTGAGSFRNDPNAGFVEAARPCTFSRDNSTPSAIHDSVFLSLGTDDPRFEISVYPSDSNDINTALPVGFPTPGPAIPPQFDTLIPYGFHFTMCEMVRTDLSPVYTLVGVTIEADGVAQPVGPIYSMTGDIGGGEIRTFMCFNSAGPPTEDTEVFAVTLNNSAVCTVTQGGWGAPPHGSNQGVMLQDAFDANSYPSGIRIGNDPGNYHIDFSGFSNVQDYLPAGKTAGALTANLSNPLGQGNSPVPPGVFGGQVLALKLNLDIGSKINLLVPPYAGNTNIGNLAIVTDELNGTTVSDFLVALNQALGGTPLSSITLPNGNSLEGFTIDGSDNTSLNYLATQLNEAFHVESCAASDWATQFLR